MRVSRVALLCIAVPLAALGATPITQCPVKLTQPGLYELQDNLDAQGDCIVVMSDAVTIDLGGYRLNGSGVGIGIQDAPASGYRGSVVRNGTVSNFKTGINVANASVESVRAVGNQDWGIVVDRGTLRNAYAQNNVTGGLYGGPATLVTGSVSQGNGIGIQVGPGGSVVDSIAKDNTYTGIYGQGNNNVSRNDASGNGTIGIFVNCPSLVFGNLSAANGGSGIIGTGVLGGCVFEHNAP